MSALCRGMSEIADELRERTLRYGLRVVAFCKRLPENWVEREIGRQLLRAGMGVSGNYWSACRGQSDREFVAKLGVAVDEADESVLWLTVVVRSGIRDDLGDEGSIGGRARDTGDSLEVPKTARENRQRKAREARQRKLTNSPTHQFSRRPYRRPSMISSSASGPGLIRPAAAGQRFVDQVQLRQEVVAIRLDVDDPGRELAAPRGFVQALQRVDLVGRVVDPLRASSRSASSRRASSLPARARLVVDRDVLEERHEADLLKRIVVLFHVGVALGRALVVVERDAGRDDVEHHRAAVRERRLEQREQLLLVAGERAGHEVAPSSTASAQVSIGGRSLTTPVFSFEPRSAVAENWPLVRP